MQLEEPVNLNILDPPQIPFDQKVSTASQLRDLMLFKEAHPFQTTYMHAEMSTMLARRRTGLHFKLLLLVNFKIYAMYYLLCRTF
jgi:hypothetical protein